MDGNVTMPLAEDECNGGNISGKEPLRVFRGVYVCSCCWVSGFCWYIVPKTGGWVARDEVEGWSLNGGRTARSKEDMNAIWLGSETI